MFEAVEVDRDSLHPWLPWVRTDNRSLPEAHFTIERMRRAHEQTSPPPTSFAIGIFDRSSAEVLGGTSLHAIRHDVHEAETGYWIRADRRRCGLCTEAVAAMISWAFTSQSAGGWELRRIHIRCAGRNVASQRVPEKLGLRLEARLLGDRWVDGIGYDDTLAWGVLASEWDIPARALKRAPA